jgi:hypothetical protein
MLGSFVLYRIFKYPFNLCNPRTALLLRLLELYAQLTIKRHIVVCLGGLSSDAPTCVIFLANIIKDIITHNE